jgi:hypothetical protein
MKEERVRACRHQEHHEHHHRQRYQLPAVGAQLSAITDRDRPQVAMRTCE